jgi:PEGA domain-containing protein
MNALAGASTGVPEVLHYTSPEQLRGEACDHRSALFSLGAILYEMATERKAFAGETAEQIRAAILDTVPPLPHRLKANLSPALSALIMKAISKSPENRFQSGQELVRELEQCKASATKIAPPAASVMPKAQATGTAAAAGAKLAPKPGLPVQPSVPAQPSATARPGPAAKPTPKPVASAAAPAAAMPASKPAFSVDPMMAEPDESAPGVAAKTSFSELEELPPLKEAFVPSISPEPTAEEHPPMLPPLTGKKVEEKQSIPIREVAQKAVAELRKTPPKVYLYGVGAAVLLIVIIVSAMAMHNYLADHDGDNSRAAVAPVQTAPAKQTTPPPTAPAAAVTQPQLEITPPPAQPEPTLTVEEQPQAPETNRRARTKTHAAAPLVAQLTVSSVPAGAQITFDGSPLCQSPCTLTDIAPGQHVVAATKAGFSSQSRTIHLKAGTSTVALQLNAVASTTLMVSSTPSGGAIVIDGHDTSRLTPTLFSFDRPGTHTVAVKRSGYLEETSTVNVQSGQAANASITLKRLGETEEIRGAGGKFKKVFNRGSASSMGIVSIKTQPKGAQILVNNRALDKTAPYDFYLNPGTYVIDISMPGYRSLHRVVDVQEGDKVAIEESLTPQ